MGKESTTENKPKFNEYDLGDNLFVNDDFKVEVTKMVITKAGASGNSYDVEVPYERQLYCKVFLNSENRKAISKLTAPAKELLLWLIMETKPGKDYVWLNRTRYMNENDILSRTTVTTAVNLLMNKFIHQSNVRGIYFINPKYLFNGNRIKKYKDNVVEYKPKSKTLEEYYEIDEL